MSGRSGGREHRRRDENDDDRYDRRDRGSRKEPERPNRTTYEESPPREPKRSKGADLNEYFVNGTGIHREVLQKEICKWLGAEATSRPGSYKGVDGYVVKAVRPFTPKMLDDLIDLSKGYSSEREEMRRRGRGGLTYGESATSRRTDVGTRGRPDSPMDDSDGLGDDLRDTRSARPRGTRDPPRNRERDIYEQQHDVHNRPYESANVYSPGPPSQLPYAPPSNFPPQNRGNERDPYNRPPGGYPAPGFKDPVRQDQPMERVYAPPSGRPRETGSDPYGVPGYQLGAPMSQPGPAYATTTGYPAGSYPAVARQEPNFAYGPGAYDGGRGPPMPRYQQITSPGGGDTTMGGMEPYDDYASVPPSTKGFQPAPRGQPNAYDRNSPDFRERDQYRREMPKEEQRRPRESRR